ncbi:hypothetical protein COC42_06785 [Sphingomonas spermidinifaciens]|uniref:Uncharacterized protein n=1 Tax=Sphingomonas spermidinifaciens TaxID=1141889 RepID=A0A2A4B493_9SPHN|nr:hypothetical protein [Sphingomonas spermidinifaciens]PCD04013.1 hypothetical protein COC42_06785 [Sphingomonas spermidinifaciens]
MSARAGRPLRFLVAVLSGWAALRVAILLPEAAELSGLVVAEAAPASPSIASLPPRMLGDWAGLPPSSKSRAAPRIPAQSEVAANAAPPIGRSVALALIARVGFGEPQRRAQPTLGAPYLPAARSAGRAPPRPFAAAPRLSGSGWLALRDGDGGGGQSLGPGGQLGGSQGGVRLRYALGAARTLALSARFSAPLEGPGHEAALGLEWRPHGVPVALIAEQRIGIDGTPGGPALLAVGGLAPRPIVAGFNLEGYAQAGGVLRGGSAQPFADGALRLAAPVANAGRAGEVTLGLGAWGGAQRDAQRLDTGPSAAIALPIGDRRLRLTLDWRQRVAGRARPGSGLALTLGSDF